MNQVSWQSRFNEPFASEALGLFRVTLGALCFLQCVAILPQLTSLFGKYGFLEADLMRHISGWSLPLLAPAIEAHGIDYNWIIYAMAGIHLTSALFFTCGVFYRASSILLWLTNVFFMNSGELSVYGVNRYLHLFSFMAIFLPLHQSFSVRRAMGTGVSPIFAIWTLRFALALTYFNAGFAKSNGIDWWTGDAVWRAVNLPEFRQFDVFWLGLYPWCFKLAAWGTLFFECFYPVAILSRRVRFFWIPVIVCMHVGISVGLGLHFFAFAMILFNLSLFSWTDFKGFKPKIFSQDESPFKCREAPFSEHDDVSQIVGNKN